MRTPFPSPPTVDHHREASGDHAFARFAAAQPVVVELLAIAGNARFSGAARRSDSSHTLHLWADALSVFPTAGKREVSLNFSDNCTVVLRSIDPLGHAMVTARLSIGDPCHSDHLDVSVRL